MKHLFSHFLLMVKLVLMLALSTQFAHAGVQVSAARVWPAQEYTRITLEADKALTYQMLVLKNPDRIVIDIENVELNAILKSLADKILSSDPYIKQVRVAKYKANMVRLVVDLKSDAKSNIFALPPAGAYKHRLVLDIYPLQDPLMAMLDKRTPDANNAPNNTEPTKPENDSSEANAGDKLKPVIEPLPPQASEEVPEIAPTPEAAEDKPNNTPTKPPETANKEGRFITIAIDAGHGGEDPGARGANGSHEKDITLAIAKLLKKKLDADPQYRAVLTRDGDYFIALHGRVVKARKLKADLFVSIHADAFTNPAARGSSVFALSEKGATSAGARYLAKKENESDLIGGVSLDDKDPVLAKTLLDLSQTATINDSLKLGKAVLKQIGDVNKLHKSHVEQAGFAVLKSPDIPSILVETAFISNPEEERRLNDDDYRNKLVDAIVSGIKKYFAGNPAVATKP